MINVRAMQFINRKLCSYLSPYLSIQMPIGVYQQFLVVHCSQSSIHVVCPPQSSLKSYFFRPRLQDTSGLDTKYFSFFTAHKLPLIRQHSPVNALILQIPTQRLSSHDMNNQILHLANLEFSSAKIAPFISFFFGLPKQFYRPQVVAL